MSSQIPKGYGISKIRHAFEHSFDVDDVSSRGIGKTKAATALQFSLATDKEEEELPPPSFNVLYVRTPRIEALETPEWGGVASLWRETKELMKPIMRFGLPETSLFTKCPYYNEDLYSTPSGKYLSNDRMRKLLSGVERGTIWEHPQYHIRQTHPPIPDLPSGALVLALNLCCYWLITKQANRI